jgi:2,3-bisphosphoglycerate-dependent phosphoglycerate mutase
VRQVQPHHVNASFQQFVQARVRCRSERCHDLRSSSHAAYRGTPVDLLLIRHALPVRREVEEGVADPELQPDGHAQAERLGEYLATEQFDAIYSSPMQRARQTAAPLARLLGMDIRIHDGVAEWDKDSKSYVPVEELKATNDPRWQNMLAGIREEGAPDPVTFQRTVVAAIEEIIEGHRGHRVAVVCHGGVINAYLSHILDMADSEGFFYPNYTCINRLVCSSKGHRQVVTINETAHLRGTNLPIGMYS